MVVLGLLILWEVCLPILPTTGLSDAAVGGLLAFLLWCIGFLGYYEVVRNFMGRMAMGFALAWYLGSIGRWIPSVDRVYTDAGEGVSLLLAMSFLVVAPLGLVLTASVPAVVEWWEVRRESRPQ